MINDTIQRDNFGIERKFRDSECGVSIVQGINGWEETFEKRGYKNKRLKGIKIIK